MELVVCLSVDIEEKVRSFFSKFEEYAHCVFQIEYAEPSVLF